MVMPVIDPYEHQALRTQLIIMREHTARLQSEKWALEIDMRELTRIVFDNPFSKEATRANTIKTINSRIENLELEVSALKQTVDDQQNKIRGLENSLSQATSSLDYKNSQLDRYIGLYKKWRDKWKFRKQKNREHVSKGHVYVVQELNDGHYKIGRTANFKNRLQTFNVKLPFKVEPIVLIETVDMYELEAELHNLFASKRVEGEWFALTESDLEYIRNHYI